MDRRGVGVQAYPGIRGACRRSLGVAVLIGLTGALAPGVASAQVPESEGDTLPAVEEAVEWNFQPLEGSAEVGRSDLEARWAAPFAVQSRGRPLPREPREVVVVRGRPAEVAADSGETAALVEVEEGDGLRERVAELAALTKEVREAVGEAPSPAEQGTDDGERATELVQADEDGEETDGDGGGEASASPRSPRTHTVARGDTLFGIARRYGVRADAIRAANDMEGDIVRLGETLVIPDEEERS